MWNFLFDPIPAYCLTMLIIFLDQFHILMDWLEWLESMRILMGLNSPCVCDATKTYKNPVCWVESFKKRPHRDQGRSAGSFFDSQTRRAQAPSAVVDTAARVASWWLTCVGAVVAAMAKMDGAGRFQQQAKTPAPNSMKIVWIHKLSDCQMWSSSEKKQCQIIYTLALYSRITTLIQAATAIPSLVDRIHILGLEPNIWRKILICFVSRLQTSKQTNIYSSLRNTFPEHLVKCPKECLLPWSKGLCTGTFRGSSGSSDQWLSRTGTGSRSVSKIVLSPSSDKAQINDHPTTINHHPALVLAVSNCGDPQTMRFPTPILGNPCPPALLLHIPLNSSGWASLRWPFRRHPASLAWHNIVSTI